MKEIRLTQGNVAIVDDEDHARLSQFKWCANFDLSTGKFIARRLAKRRVVRMHECVLGKKPGFQIGHINLDPLDNRKSNLRYATKGQNLCNKRLYKNNTLGFKGVFQNNMGHFTARIVVDGRRHSVGTFQTLIEAACAYNRGAIQHYGEFARLNEL